MFGFIFRPRFNCVDVVAVATMSAVWSQGVWIAVCLYVLFTFVSAAGECAFRNKREGE